MMNRVTGKLLLCVLLAAACPAALRAASDPGTTGANFLKIPVAVIPGGMADAYTAMVGPDSILYNPAGLGLLSYSSFSGSHNQYLESISQEYLALVYSSPYGTVGAAYSALASGSIDAYDTVDMPIGKTSTAHTMMMLSYAWSWPHFRQDAGRLDPMLITPSWTKVEPVTDYRPRSYRVAVGGSVKKISEKLDSETASAQAFDAGLLVLLPGHIHIGLSALNFGGGQKLVQESYPLPSSLRFGLAKDFHTVNDVIIFTLASDMVKYRDRDPYSTTGAEVDVLRMFQFRVGYQTGKDTGSPLCGGFGMNFDRLSDKDSLVKGLRADYAYIGYGELGATHRFGIQLIW
ncbi:MAG TPA: hypothetical protein PKI19_02590 [Elusimicrobiales bacterium]|mgnify:CR=1 FL=1|nr:hypothetical protein [Elusimicrobiales bacterium]